MNQYSNRVRQMYGLGSNSSQLSPNSAVPPRSRAPSASTPSDEYLMALNKMNKAKGQMAKRYYQMEAERIKMRG